MKISNQPPKGTSDWLPEEFEVRKYIFDTWREVCTTFGYQEYLTPLLEYADLYRAKSGEDLGGKELMVMNDRAGRELSIRPEMTPSVTRMVSKIYESAPKPLRLFSIANFFRNEKPQRGRNREFWQLNFDIFGSKDINSDIEILQIGIEIMLKFGAPKGSFTLFLNNRKLINSFLEKCELSEQNRVDVVRVLDKWEKLSEEQFIKRLGELSLNSDQIETLLKFMQSESEEQLIKNFPEIEENEGLIEIRQIINTFNSLGYSEWVQFKPNIIRGFDYYDGVIFEVFDNHPDNRRAMFGGGRYNGLAQIFGSQSFPAVGCAPGDETTKLFLESWNLLNRKSDRKDITYVPILAEEAKIETLQLIQKLRNQGCNIESGVGVSAVGKAIAYADKQQYKSVILLGSNELIEGIYKEKNLQSGEEKIFNL